MLLASVDVFSSKLFFSEFLLAVVVFSFSEQISEGATLASKEKAKCFKYLLKKNGQYQEWRQNE